MNFVGRRSAIVRLVPALFLALILAGCSTIGTRQPVPDVLFEQATVGMDSSLRFWGDEPAPDHVAQSILEGREKYAQARSGPPRYLTLSGGGHNGAYGAGFMLGWTARGDRPEFDVVSGISVGAMIAPMAFLGPEYDQRLLDVFAQLAVDRDRGPGLVGALFGAPAIESNAPLVRAVEKLIDWNSVTAIAREHERGRRLFVGTTNLDAERPVIWDIGALAASRLPNRVDLIRQVILASAAIPGIFPPVMIDVSAGGARFDEMHVDGGVTQNVLLFSGTFDVLAGRSANAELYVIYNGQVVPGVSATGTTTLDILSRAVPALLKYSGRADLNMLKTAAERQGIAFRVTAVDPAFPDTLDIFPPTEWLAELFQHGYQAGLAGQWRDGF